MPRRIVFHVPSLRGGGAERVFVLMANEMARRGHEVTLFVWNSEGPNAALRSDAVHLVDLGMPVHGESFGKPATLNGLRRSVGFYRRLGFVKAGEDEWDIYYVRPCSAGG